MKKMLFILCLAAVTGCAPDIFLVKTGNPLLTTQNIARIQTGITKADVLEILGEPASTVQNAPLIDMWIYSYTENQTKYQPFYKLFSRPELSGFSRSFTVSFDPQGMVSNISKSESNLYQPLTMEFK